jgi:hypothetical protein
MTYPYSINYRLPTTTAIKGLVPPEFSELGCIVNLAGNPKLEHGPDVPAEERQALVDIFSATNGNRWNNKTNWNSTLPVAKWYKVRIMYESRVTICLYLCM